MLWQFCYKLCAKTGWPGVTILLALQRLTQCGFAFDVIGEITLWPYRERYGQGQRKLEDFGRGLLPAVEGHSLE